MDFNRAGEVFQRKHLTRRDDRFDYGEERFTTVGWYGGRLVAVTWTPRGEVRRIISMRYMHEKEQRTVRDALE
ncbi:BrnT family toxin [Pseudomonas lopnurensis]|uniref:BrnT family toxin n=1 Tax=Pseudomonas lopnurensis TaxID=1477517 RepID=UPI001879BCF7|nr:BrnT family toxin [Pseudomonas lopnurensis]MBE7377217.1 BrnT family toxin [Pseudomonas lopnurensis]